VYVKSREEWKGWNEWRGGSDLWTRKYIFSFIDFPTISNAYLFGGIFEVKERHIDRYIVDEIKDFSKWEGRLICKFFRPKIRQRALYAEKYIDSFEVLQILPQRFDGEIFPGYEKINHSFSDLQPIIEREKQDWKTHLTAVKGIYLIIDQTNGKSYVGSAYGEDTGIWSRLSQYIGSGHGGNVDLKKTILDRGRDYALSNFKFSVLEVFSLNTHKDVIFNRECHWKDVLLSRQHGYNKN
jgi:hypothetical protein